MSARREGPRKVVTSKATPSCVTTLVLPPRCCARWLKMFFSCVNRKEGGVLARHEVNGFREWS